MGWAGACRQESDSDDDEQAGGVDSVQDSPSRQLRLMRAAANEMQAAISGLREYTDSQA